MTGCCSIWCFAALRTTTPTTISIQEQWEAWATSLSTRTWVYSNESSARCWLTTASTTTWTRISSMKCKQCPSRTSQMWSLVLNFQHSSCRYTSSELHTISAFLGGCAAHEAIKLLTNQFVPINNTLIYDGVKQTVTVFEFWSNTDDAVWRWMLFIWKSLANLTRFHFLETWLDWWIIYCLMLYWINWVAKIDHRNLNKNEINFEN